MGAAYLLLAALVVLEAVQQGVLVWCLREFSPETYNGVRLSRYTGFALHVLGVASYVAVAGWIGYKAGLPYNAAYWAVVLILRVALFDPALNLTRNYVNRLFEREWEPVFGVGTSSLTDKVIQWASKLIGANPSYVSGAVRVVAVALLVWLI